MKSQRLKDSKTQRNPFSKNSDCSLLKSTNSPKNSLLAIITNQAIVAISKGYVKLGVDTRLEAGGGSKMCGYHIIHNAVSPTWPVLAYQVLSMIL